MTATTGGPEGRDPAFGTIGTVDDAARAADRRERIASMLQRSGAFLILAAVTVIASLVFGTRFASVDNLLNILEASSFLGLVAVGMTFVIIGGGIDLSVGSLLALSAVLAAYGSQYGSVVAVALPLGVCGLIGLFNGLLIARARMAAVHRDPGRAPVRARPRLCRVRRGQHDLPPRQPAGRHLAGPGIDHRDPGADHHRRDRIPRRLGRADPDPATAWR